MTVCNRAEKETQKYQYSEYQCQEGRNKEDKTNQPSKWTNKKKERRKKIEEEPAYLTRGSSPV